MEMHDNPSTSNINTLFDQLETGHASNQQDVIKKLQAIRLWQLMQQEELKKQQQTQLAFLKSQQNPARVTSDHLEVESEDEILAVPISDFQPVHLDTIFEQSVEADSSMFDDGQEKEAIKTPIQDVLNDVGDDNDIHGHITSDVCDVDERSDHSSFIIGDSKETGNNDYSDEDEHENFLNNCPNQFEDKNNLKLTKFESEKIRDSEFVEANDELHSDIESSFENKSAAHVEFDNVPVKGGKTFEQILEEQLSKAQVKISSKETTASTPKRTFLRKGQGIARFNGPPKRSKFKKKPQAEKKLYKMDNIPVTIMTNQKPSTNLLDQRNVTSTDSNTSEPTEVKVNFNSPQNSNDAGANGRTELLVTKPCIRKTARIVYREPIKQLNLKPEPTVSQDLVIIPEELTVEEDQHEDSPWSDVDDSALVLDTTKNHNETSNETFEQMEQFCNEHYADISNFKTLECDDSILAKKVEPMPANKLMMSLFPSLRPSKNNSVNPSFNAKTSSHMSKQTSQKADNESVTKSKQQVVEKFVDTEDDSGQSVLLKTKLEEMKAEIKRFQDETAKLSTVRKQEEDQLKLLKTEFEEFQRQKEDELKRLEDYKKVETKKLKKDRKVFEEHVASVKSLPNKMDREYIQELEKRITELQSESKTKEQRLTAVSNRLRSQLDNVTKENAALTEKVKQLEEKLQKIERRKEIKKNKEANIVWSAINDIVDSIPKDNENINIDDYIKAHENTGTPQVQVQQVKPKPQSKSARKPLGNRNDNNHLNNSQELMPPVMTHDGKIERRLKDGSLQISFQNGTQKVVSPDGNTMIKFANGDVKTICQDGTIVYDYTSSGTRHTTHTNGMQVIEFSNKQTERHFPDGSKHISFEDGSSKMMKLDGTEETIYPDGTVMVVAASGNKTIEFSNGQREIHTQQFKRREYPDGTCKTVFSDGRQETKYSSGRLRIKDADGNLLVDEMINS